MKRPSIKTALSSALGLIAVAVVSFAFIAVNSMQTLENNSEELATLWLPKVSLSKELEISLNSLRRSYLNRVVALDDAAANAAETAIVEQQKVFTEGLEQYERMSESNEERKIAADIRSKFVEIDVAGKSIIDLAHQKKLEEAIRVQQTTLKPLGSGIESLLDRVASLNDEGAERAHQASLSTYHSAMQKTWFVISACLVALAGSIYFAISSVAKPVETITSAMKTLAAGNTQAEIPFAGRDDEIGAMAAAVEVFRQNAVSAKRLEEAAELHRNSIQEQRDSALVEDRRKADRMRFATSGLDNGLKQLAAGNLTFQLSEPFAPDFEGLRENFNASIQQLADVMRSVSQSAISIDGGSQEISQSANDLSRRTEQQAASLEETAAALDEITVNVSQASRRAEEAKLATIEANDNAARSGVVVAKAVDAMQRIEQSSRQISNIIGVIDEIAFQTNLLALNAGVEAARAGEAGKGFAVVAQEVRELAQRSAQAAKEIKELIRNSNAEVENGVKFVSETGSALQIIESNIVTITRHMEAIATSAKEQSVGLGEVNTAVNQMDQVTQQNAAMVEETNAASATLAAQSAQLRDLITRFELEGSSQYAVAKAVPVRMSSAAPNTVVPLRRTNGS